MVHLETPRKGLERLRYEMDLGGVTLNTLVRDVGSARTSRWIATQSSNPIIAGDFNLPVESRIDHVLPCGSWRATHAEIGPDLGSNHLPLIVDLARSR